MREWVEERWARLGGGFLLAAALAAVLVQSGGPPADARYCHGIYDHAGSTPEWVVRDKLFSDYRSCIDWYDAAADEVGPSYR